MIDMQALQLPVIDPLLRDMEISGWLASALIPALGTVDASLPPIGDESIVQLAGQLQSMLHFINGNHADIYPVSGPVIAHFIERLHWITYKITHRLDSVNAHGEEVAVLRTKLGEVLRLYGGLPELNPQETMQLPREDFLPNRGEFNQTTKS